MTFFELMVLIDIVKTDRAMIQRINRAGMFDDAIKRHTDLIDRLTQLLTPAWQREGEASGESSTEGGQQ